MKKENGLSENTDIDYNELVYRYLHTKKDTGRFFKEAFGESVFNEFFNYAPDPFANKNHPVSILYTLALHHVQVCDFKELPLYANHPSPNVREIVQERLETERLETEKCDES